MLGDPATAGEVWFVLHGYRQLAERFIQRFSALPGAGGARAIVAPEALSRFYIEDEVGPHGPESRVGATWMTRADRDNEIRDYVGYLDLLAESLVVPPGSGSRRIVVLGFSQGAETASRWAAYGRVPPDELVLWAGGLAADLDPGRAAGALGGTKVRLVVGSEDRWADGRAAESERRLLELGLPEPERIVYAGGHVIRPETLAKHWPEP